MLYSLYKIKGEKYGSTKRIKTQDSFKRCEVGNLSKIRNQPKPSMSRRGKPTDNAVMESIFSRYRAEIKGFPKPKSIDDVKRNAFDWVWFYDKDRISLPKNTNKKKNFNYDKAVKRRKN